MMQQISGEEVLERRYKSVIYYCIFTIIFFITILVVYNISIIINLEPSLFIPTSIGVVGSFLLFFYRENVKRRRFIRFILQELKTMDGLDEISELVDDLNENEDTGMPPNQDLPADKLPPPSALSTKIYEAILPEFSRFDKELSTDIIDFYSELIRHKSTIEELHSGKDVRMPRQEDLCEDIDEICNRRKMLIIRLESQLT